MIPRKSQLISKIDTHQSWPPVPPQYPPEFIYEDFTPWLSANQMWVACHFRQEATEFSTGRIRAGGAVRVGMVGSDVTE